MSKSDSDIQSPAKRGRGRPRKEPKRDILGDIQLNFSDETETLSFVIPPEVYDLIEDVREYLKNKNKD